MQAKCFRSVLGEAAPRKDMPMLSQDAFQFWRKQELGMPHFAWPNAWTGGLFAMDWSRFRMLLASISGARVDHVLRCAWRRGYAPSALGAKVPMLRQKWWQNLHHSGTTAACSAMHNWTWARHGELWTRRTSRRRKAQGPMRPLFILDRESGEFCPRASGRN